MSEVAQTFVLEGAEYNAKFGAVGLEAVSQFLETVRIGAFLKLTPGESVVVRLRSKEDIALWTVHTIRFIDGGGEDGVKIIPCAKIYLGKDCEHCASSDPKVRKTSIRTAAIFNVFRHSQEGASRGSFLATRTTLLYQDTLIFEGGPTVWKHGIIPCFKESGMDAYLKITRFGAKKDTKYTVVAVANPSISKEEAAKAEAGQSMTSLAEALTRSTETEDIPF